MNTEEINQSTKWPQGTKWMPFDCIHTGKTIIMQGRSYYYLNISSHMLPLRIITCDCFWQCLFLVTATWCFMYDAPQNIWLKFLLKFLHKSMWALSAWRGSIVQRCLGLEGIYLSVSKLYLFFHILFSGIALSILITEIKQV